jgi:hypothetical protein
MSEPHTIDHPNMKDLNPEEDAGARSMCRGAFGKPNWQRVTTATNWGDFSLCMTCEKCGYHLPITEQAAERWGGMPK